MKICAVILAGGLGTRIRAAIGDKAKILAAVENVTFLELFLGLLRRSGINQVLLLTGFDAQAVEEQARQLSDEAFQVECIREDQPLGTGGAVVAALAALPAEGAFLIMNGDTWIDFDPAGLLGAHEKSGAEITIAATPMDDCADYGSLDVDDEHWLRGFREKVPGRGLVNAGVYVTTRAVIDSLPRTCPLSMERDVFPALVTQHRPLQVVALVGPFYDIGTPERLELFRSLVAKVEIESGS